MTVHDPNKLTIQAGQGQEFEAKIRRVMPKVREEPRNHPYIMPRAQDQPRLFTPYV